MRNEAESWKKLYIGVTGGLLLLLPTYFFYIVWREEFNKLQNVVFKNKGNWLIIFCFVLILGIMLHTFKGVRIGYYKMGSLIISQLLSVVYTSYRIGPDDTDDRQAGAHRQDCQSDV